MVGGIVVETLDVTSRDLVWINVKDQKYGDTCALYVERTDQSLRVAPGDCVWWQGRTAYWTPSQFLGHTEAQKQGYYGVRYDIALKRLGYSGAKHPAQALFDPEATE